MECNEGGVRVRFFSYVVPRDFGFAPNPFNGICTLATCKPPIRQAAVPGDWVFGTGAVEIGKNRLIYAMKVKEKITFEGYWNDPRFACKKPVINGSLKTMYGDNIYHRQGEGWQQADSHHSLEGGVINPKNLKRDTSVDAVLVSDHFYYFGKTVVNIPADIVDGVCKTGPGFKYVDAMVAALLIKYLEANFELGYHGDPIHFEDFQRYDGPS